MATREPFIRSQALAGWQEPDALLGFALPFLPDMRTSPWLTGSTPRERLHEALQLQVRLIHALWRSSITAFDLRFIGTDTLPGIAIALLCRVRRPPAVPPARFRDHCLALARYASRLFADSGFELQPLLDEASLVRYITPFHFHVAAELRKAEELLVLQEAYTEYEVYAPHPWSWTVQNRLRLLEALLHRQSDCMVSVYLEPTQLSPQEQSHLSHATSSRMRSLLHAGGPAGDAVYHLYATYARNLQQPYLLRASIAAAAAATAEQIGRMFIDELSTGQDTGTAAPVLVYPQNHQEWQMACQSLWQLSWFPWGLNRGSDLPGTARLRYLVDAETASMAFRIPVAMQGELSGIPVRALYPEPATPATSSTGMPATPFTPPINSTGPYTSTEIRQPGTPSSVLTGLQAPEDLIGHTLGNCQIEALLGKGGFGAVYRARQAHLDRVVAVKVVLAMLTTSGADQQQLDKLLRRFQREAQALARMDHPHILPLYEYQQQPIPYLIMPYIPGGSLADELQASGHRPLPVRGVAALLAQVASALDHAHGQQLVHRDLKPHNLLRHADGRILLSDFGIVQFEDGTLTALTTSGSHSPYTPAYASPEQHQWLPVDYRSDIYSLGIIVYELLCGHRPFSVPYEYVHTAPPPLRNFGVAVPPTLEAVVQKALARRPDDRYQSAGAMASAFQAAIAAK